MDHVPRRSEPSVLAFHSINFSPLFGATTPLLDVVGAAAEAGFTEVGLDLASVEAFLLRDSSLDGLVAAFAAAELRCSDVLPIIITADAAAVGHNREHAAASMPADLVDDSRNHRLIPGEGGLDLSCFVSSIQATGYHGPISAEVLSSHVRAGDPSSFAIALHRAMAAAWTPGPVSG